MVPNSVHDTRVLKSVITLSNANELVSAIIKNIAGEDVSDSLNGTRLTTNMINLLAQARFKEYLLKERYNNNVNR